MLENTQNNEHFMLLPQAVQNSLNGKSKYVQFVQESDCTLNRKFGKSFIVVTDKELLVTDETHIVNKFELIDIKEVKIDELSGGGRLTVIGNSGRVNHLLYYSNHLVPHFAAAVRFIAGCLRGTGTNIPEKQRHGYCERCKAPLPERDSRCPRCVPKLKILTRIIGLTKPYKFRVFMLMLVTAIGVGFQVLPPYLTKKIIDDVIGKHQIDKLYLYVGAMAGAGIFYLIMRLINIRLTTWISARIVSDLRSRLHSVLQYLKLSFLSRREPGEIVGRVMYDTGELLQFLVEGMPFLLVNTISFFVVAAILIHINWTLAIFVFLPVPFLIIGSSWFWKRLHPLFLRQGSIIAHIHSVLTESIEGLRVVKAFSQEKKRISLFDAANARLAQTHINTNRVFGSFNEVMFWVMSFGVTLVWFFATKMITGDNPNLTIGDLLAFIGYIWLFYGPLQWFSVILNWMTHAFSGAERIFEIIDTAPETYDHVNAVSLPSVKGHVEFNNVRFSYDRGKEVIKGISLSIKPGEVIGLVGKSGAGKSTIINLLSRFFEPDDGSISIDGVPIQRIKLTQLRASLGIVLQEPFLFNASIAENIAYGLEHASFKEIIEASKAAYAHEFIIRKQDGYDTIIGESGEKLSGGEKQRIAIARAVLHNPPILILDEATSAVDATTEEHIQEAITRLIKGRTTIAIAHRLSTLRNADRLIVIDNGKIAETGTHDELMLNKGIYAELAESYTKMNSLRSVVWGG